MQTASHPQKAASRTTSSGDPSTTATPVFGTPPSPEPDVPGQPPGSVPWNPPAPATRLLRRSKRDSAIGGVCGGLGRYFGVDPVLFRIVAVALALSGGFGVLAYVIAWVAIPEATDEDERDVAAPRTTTSSATSLAVGAAFIAIGALLLIRAFAPWFGANLLGPAVIMAVGAVVIASGRGRQP